MATRRTTTRETPPRAPLVLGRTRLRQRMAELFQRLDEDEKARRRFIQNPVGLIQERVFQEKLPAQRASEANRLLFSVLANEAFSGWLETYAAEHRGKRIDKARFHQDFARALVEFG